MIKRATIEDVTLVAPLFDLYRQFYKQSSDLPKAQKFLKERLLQQQSVIFIALENGKAVGFTQLYPIFSSVSACPQWVLNDLFVFESERGRGTGESLIKTAMTFAKDSGANGLSLATAFNNPAQRLYERLGFKESSYKHYEVLL